MEKTRSKKKSPESSERDALSLAASILGRKGGKIGSVMRMKKMSREERVRLAKHAIEIRWRRHREAKAAALAGKARRDDAA